MPVSNFRDKDFIQSGDLLIWKYPDNSIFSKCISFIVRLFTLSEYSHVGIAHRVYDNVFVVEATSSGVYINLLTTTRDCYHIPMNIEWSFDKENYLLSKEGSPYSIWEALTGYLWNKTIKNNKWQCVELANSFFEYCGLKYPGAYTPSKLVEALLEEGRPLNYINIK